MAVKTFTTGEVLTAADTNTYLNNGGLVYITEANPAGTATTISFNNVFTSTYRTYKIFGSLSPNNAGTTLSFRFRVGGADYAGAQYYDRGYLNTTGAVAAVNNLAVTLAYLPQGTNNDFTGFELTLFNPQIANRTHWNMQGIDAWSVGMANTSGIVAQTTQYDGITFISGAGNLTGKIIVCGVRQA